MQLPVTSWAQQSSASQQPLQPSVSASLSGSLDLALLFNWFIRYAISTQASPSSQTAPAALLPASIEDSIEVTPMHLQLLPFDPASRQLSLLSLLNSNFHDPAHPISPSPVLYHFLAVSSYLSQLCLSSPSSCNYPSFSKPSHQCSSQPPQWYNILP